MELRHLRYLVAIADAGTFVAAAGKLRVAQPALSRQMRDLERELEAELFEAGARKATLTPAGEACVRIARHVIHDAEHAVNQARLSESGLVGRCVVAGASVPMRTGMVGKLVARMQAKYPGITIEVREAFEGKAWDAVADAEADISLGVPAPASYPHLASEMHYMHTVTTALVAPAHPLAKRKRVKLSELRDEPFYVFRLDSPEIRSIVEKLEVEMKKLGFRDPDARDMPNFESVLAHVRTGRGWTMVPDLLRGRVHSLVSIEVTDFKVMFPTARVWRRTDSRPVVQRVLAELRLMQLEDRDGRHAAADTAKRPARFVSPRLELRHLRSFGTVAASGSIGRAAEQLDITQPALSRQMRDLEHDVGVALFERGTRGVAVTTAGQILLAGAQAVLAVVDQLRSEAQRAKRGSSEECILAVAPHPLVDRIVSELLANATDASAIKLHSLSSSSIAEAVQKSEVDLGFAYAYPARVPGSPGLARVPLFDDIICAALLSPSHPLASRDVVSLRDLVDTPFLFPPREVFPPVYDVVMHQFEVAGGQPRVQAAYEGALTIWALTSQGLGWSLGLRSQLRIPPQGTVAIPLSDFRLDWGGELIYRREESRAPILAIIDGIVEISDRLFKREESKPARRRGRKTDSARVRRSIPKKQ
jgi:DNA-binding transcriptional LysR family regulator